VLGCASSGSRSALETLSAAIGETFNLPGGERRPGAPQLRPGTATLRVRVKLSVVVVAFGSRGRSGMAPDVR